MTLNELKNRPVRGHHRRRRRRPPGRCLLDMGLIPRTAVKLMKVAPMGGTPSRSGSGAIG